MNRFFLILALIFFSPFCLLAQEKDTLKFKGQLSTWVNYNITNENLNIGARYIPELGYENCFASNKKINLELSGNGYGTWNKYNKFDGDIKPYRAWARYATTQFEVRTGLQKINFGSATLLRPLMWFDQMDARDPLQLTNGVWSVLGRYYFQNNTNIWLWGLYGNKELKGWEQLQTQEKKPEFGGRIQFPFPIGEMALSYHHRIASTSRIKEIMGLTFDNFGENKLGFDTKIDWVVGLWLEGSWSNSSKNIGLLSNQTLLNAGIDYTFGLGNGLLAVYEHLLASSDYKPFELKNTFNFSLLSLSYPIGLFDNVGTIFYYSWEMNQVYSFFNWQRTFNKLSFHLMAYWNPETLNLPQQNLGSNMFGGKGVQVMLVFNH
jgi:hypothetical protein